MSFWASCEPPTSYWKTLRKVSEPQLCVNRCLFTDLSDISYRIPRRDLGFYTRISQHKRECFWPERRSETFTRSFGFAARAETISAQLPVTSVVHWLIFVFRLKQSWLTSCECGLMSHLYPRLKRFRAVYQLVYHCGKWCPVGKKLNCPLNWHKTILNQAKAFTWPQSADCKYLKWVYVIIYSFTRFFIKISAFLLSHRLKCCCYTFPVFTPQP